MEPAGGGQDVRRAAQRLRPAQRAGHQPDLADAALGGGRRLRPCRLSVVFSHRVAGLAAPRDCGVVVPSCPAWPPPPHTPPHPTTPPHPAPPCLQGPQDDGGSPIQYYQVQVRARTPAARSGATDEWLAMYQVGGCRPAAAGAGAHVRHRRCHCLQAAGVLTV